MYNSEKFLNYLDKSSQKCDENSVREYFQIRKETPRAGFEPAHPGGSRLAI